MKTTTSPKKSVAKSPIPNISPTRVDNTVFIRTVTHYFTGRIVALSAEEIVLADAAWIADTGRFSNALKSGTLSEVEPYPDGARVAVARGGVIDVSDWLLALPREVR